MKTGPKYRLDNERKVLGSFLGRRHIRQLVDEVVEPPCLVLEYLDDNLLNASNVRKLAKADIKCVARNILEALKIFHDVDYVHTGMFVGTEFSHSYSSRSFITVIDIKPDNILINYSNGPARFSKVKLGDCGDTYHVDPNAAIKRDGHIIGAAIFRSPEAMLNLRWGKATDIWSFGATVSTFV